MADHGESKRSRFLGKSKWGKVFKENDSAPSSGRNDTFKLNDDVNDFLKPSIEASAEKIASTRTHLAPKLDTTIAKRFPDAHDVQAGSPAAGRIEQAHWPSKPPRRKGLAVAFVRTMPEIIGEGGDDALDPPSEVSRNKSKMLRSVSDRRPIPGDPLSWQGEQNERPLPPQGQPQIPLRQPQNPANIPPIRRVNTSHHELSPPLQRKVASPPIREPSPPIQLLSRALTGFPSEEQMLPVSPDGTEHLPLPRVRPGIDPRDYEGGSTRRDMPTFQRDMRANEGMALRRASAMFRDENTATSETKLQLNTGFEPPSTYYNALSETSPPSLHLAPRLLTDSETGSVRTTSKDPIPTGHFNPSPFADPRYFNRRQEEIVSPAMTVAPNGPKPQTQAADQRLYDSSYTRTASSSESQSRQGSLFTSQSHQGQNPHQLLPIRTGPPEIVSAQTIGTQPYTTSNQSQYPQDTRLPQASSERQSSQESNSRGLHTGNEFTATGQNNNYTPYHNAGKPRPIYSQPVYSNGSIDQITSSHLVDSPASSHSSFSPQTYEQRLADPSRRVLGDTGHYQSPQSSLLYPIKPASGYSSRGPSPAGQPPEYHAMRQPSQTQSVKSPVTSLRQEQSSRPGSSDSSYSFQKSPLSPSSSIPDDPSQSMALADFESRTAHMKGVFRLTAEKERPAQQCSPSAWIRIALWWYLSAKADLEKLARERKKNPSSNHEVLIQPHVDLAKSCWIIAEPLESYSVTAEAGAFNGSLQSSSPGAMSHTISLLKMHVTSLTVKMQRDYLMPPHQSLIQGQDTRLWLPYPRFMPDAASVIGGSVDSSLAMESPMLIINPLEALPLGDTREMFCYGRFPVDASLSTDDAESDRVALPCVASMLRNKHQYQTSLVIASQSDLIDIRIDPSQANARGISWQNITWKSNTSTIILHLARGFDVSVRMQDRDYRALWNLVDYARRVEQSLRPRENERLAHQVTLAELQYADSSNAHSFPVDKIRGCMAVVFERTQEQNDGAGVRKMHRGFRLLLITDYGHKSLSSVSHELCRRAPLLYEFLTDATANGTTAMVLRIREDNRQCRILLVFPDMASRQGLYDILTGLSIGPGEAIVSKTTVTGLNICSAFHPKAFSPVNVHPALQNLQWQRLGVTNVVNADQTNRAGPTVGSEALRLIARHTTGCITDRLNLSKGELLIRLPCDDSPAIHLLRAPQDDLIMSVDTRHAQPQSPDGIAEILQLAQQQPTIRTLTFATKEDLHDFQHAITGVKVIFDGLASTFGISRRRMVVSIHHKWTASSVRVQIVQRGGIGGGTTVTQVVAFMEGFSHADALCFPVRSTDVFEAVKGDGKSKKWAVKLVEAKFTLPPPADKEEKDGVGATNGGVTMSELLRRFANLEGLDYAAEHDDITVGFETQDERDQFAQALPAPTSVTRMMTLKRRI